MGYDHDQLASEELLDTLIEIEACIRADTRWYMAEVFVRTIYEDVRQV